MNEKNIGSEIRQLGFGSGAGLPEPIAYLPEPWLQKLWKISQGYGEVITELQVPWK